MEELLSYIENVTGKKVRFLNENNETKFPRYISNLYSWQTVEILGYKCALINLKYDRLIVENLIKHLKVISEGIEVHPILIFNQLNPEQRERLISNNIPFVVSKSQLFLPFVFMDFRKEVLKGKEINLQFTPSIQLIFLYVFYHDEEKFIAKDISTFCKVSTMTVNRSLSVLLELGVIEKVGYAKDVFYKKIKPRKEMFKICKESLINPIRKKVNIAQESINMVTKLTPAGEYALSRLGMLTEKATKQYAIDIETYKELKKNNIVNSIDYLFFNTIELEVWKYDPTLIGGNLELSVDWLSLYLSLREEQDERVQIELDILLDRLWRD